MSAVKLILIVTFVAAFAQQISAAVPDRASLNKNIQEQGHQGTSVVHEEPTPAVSSIAAMSMKPIKTDVNIVGKAGKTTPHALSLEPTCSYCGGMTASQCSTVCAELDCPYYWCRDCDCLCHFG